MFIPKHLFRKLIDDINKEVGQPIIKLSTIKQAGNKPYYDAILKHDKEERKVLEIFVKCKNTKALRNFEQEYKAVLKMDNYQLKIGF